MELQVAQIVDCTEAEGPGRRFALWFQGCPLRCPGCCNPEMLPFRGGATWTLEAVRDRIAQARTDRTIEGITLLGGEPFAHPSAASGLAKIADDLDLSVMVFSGHTLEQLRAMAETDPDIHALLDQTDILIDGRYLREHPEPPGGRRWVGSTNQRVHFLGRRAQADDPRWSEPNTLEIRLVDGSVSVNGFPSRSALGLWKRPRRADRAPTRHQPPTPPR